MNLDHLRYFIELAHMGSFARASRALFISPQGLNKAIGAMEAELGVNLVLRGNHGTTLTADGALFLAYAENAVAQFDETAHQLAVRKREALGDASFAIGATSYALHTVFEGPFDPTSFGFLRVQEMGPTEIARAVARADAQLFVTDLIDGSSTAEKCLEGSVFLPIFHTEFGVICHENFPLAKSSLTAEDLREIPLVCYHDESIDWLMSKYLDDGAAGNVLLRTSNSEQLVKYVMAQSAVSLLDSFAHCMMGLVRMSHAESIRFVPVMGLPRVTTGFLYNAEVECAQEMQLFIDAYMIAFRHRYAAYLRRYPLA